MTDAKMALRELVEQEADAGLVCEMLAFAAERMMDMEIEAMTGAPAGARSADRLMVICLLPNESLQGGL